MKRKKSASNKAVKKAKSKRYDSQPIDLLPSLQSMEGLIGGRSIRSAVDEAQQVMCEAWEAPTRQRAVALARKALEISTDCADAYVLLTAETANSLEEIIDLYRKGVEAGARALGPKTFRDDAGYFWGILETRPYMRARAGLAQRLWEAGKREEAIEHYREILRLNPNDNQGIRDLLMPCLIELGRDNEAERLFNRYKEDGMAVWLYSRALLDFRKHGDSSVADQSLQAALEENKHVPGYLLGFKKIPRDLPDYYGFGDDNEAVYYVNGNQVAWKASPGALEWLAAKAK